MTPPHSGGRAIRDSPLSGLTLISVPFHLGVRAVGMGKGPLELIGDGALPDRLRGAGHDLELVDVPAPAEDHEVGRIFELNRDLARVVGAARKRGHLASFRQPSCFLSVLSSYSPCREPPGLRSKPLARDPREKSPHPLAARPLADRKPD